MGRITDNVILTMDFGLPAMLAFFMMLSFSITESERYVVPYVSGLFWVAISAVGFLKGRYVSIETLRSFSYIIQLAASRVMALLLTLFYFVAIFDRMQNFTGFMIIFFLLIFELIFSVIGETGKIGTKSGRAHRLSGRGISAVGKIRIAIELLIALFFMQLGLAGVY